MSSPQSVITVNVGMMSLIPLVLAWIAWIPLTQGEPTTHEYCQLEKFYANCTDGQVVMMTKAEYGRMRVGRCLTTNYYTGCSANVMDHADEKCSGRSSCVINLPDPTFFNVQPCRKDLVAYFEAGYECIPVVNPLLDEKKKTFCRGIIYTEDQQEGYLASTVTARTGLGSRQCPWGIKVQSGQRINITLYDFSATSQITADKDTTGVSSTKVKDTTSCSYHALLEEGDSLIGDRPKPVSVSVCGRKGRRRWIHTTQGPNLIVKMINVTRETAQTINFLLHYEVIGCPDIGPVHNGRTVRNGDSLMVSCNNTQETWHLVCKGTSWIGEYHNCTTRQNEPVRGDNPEEDQGFPLGLLVAIAIGVVVGVVLGFVFLIAIFICRKRRRQEFKHESGNPLMGGSPLDSDQQNIYRLVEVRPPPSMMCECHLSPGTDPKFGTLDNKLGLQAPPNECIYRTVPRFNQECHYQSREGDTFPPGTPLKTCDIISDLHMPANSPCCNGEECYVSSNCIRQNGQNESGPRIKPFPTFNPAERSTITSVGTPPSRENVGEVFETKIYQPR